MLKENKIDYPKLENKDEFYVMCIKKDLITGEGHSYPWFLENKIYRAKHHDKRWELYVIYGAEYPGYENRWASVDKKSFKIVSNESKYEEEYIVVYGAYRAYKEIVKSHEAAMKLALEKAGSIYKLVGKVVEEEVITKSIQKVFKEI